LNDAQRLPTVADESRVFECFVAVSLCPHEIVDVLGSCVLCAAPVREEQPLRGGFAFDLRRGLDVDVGVTMSAHLACFLLYCLAISAGTGTVHVSAFSTPTAKAVT